MPGHEFFTTLTVAQALHGFRPARRTAAETVALADALQPGTRRGGHGDVRAARVRPGRPSTGSRCGPPTPTGRRTGCRATSTSPGRSRWAGRPTVAVVPGAAVAVPTGRRAAAGGRRGRDGRAHPGGDAGHDRGGARRRARRRDGPRRRGRAHRERCSRRPGARCVPRTSACSRPRASTGVGVCARAAGRHPVHRRRGRPAGDRDPATRPGARRDRLRAGRAGDRARRRPRDPRASCPTTRAALETALRDAVATCDLVVVSAGSSVGARDETAIGGQRPGRRRASSATGSRSARASRPCWPSAAECPLIGLPGNPLSALVVFRLVGVPVLHRVGGCTAPPPEPPCPGPPRAAGRVGRRAARRRAGAA